MLTLWTLLQLNAPCLADDAGTADGAIWIGASGQVQPAAALTGPAAVSGARAINLDFQDADIHSVLRTFSTFAGINIVAGDDVQGTVTVRMVDVPWDTALAVILHTTGLAAVSMDGVWLVGASTQQR